MGAVTVAQNYLLTREGGSVSDGLAPRDTSAPESSTNQNKI